MDPSCFITTVQALSSPVVPAEHRFNTQAYSSIVADHVQILYAHTVFMYHVLTAVSSRITRSVTNLGSLHTGVLRMRVSEYSEAWLPNRRRGVQRPT